MQTELRRQFKLPPEDEAYLNGLNLKWEAVVSGNQWIIIHGWKLPEGYLDEQVKLALLIAPAYPDSQIDMFYAFPALARKDTKPINRLTSIPICGETWQQWSRHRTPANPWRPGEDDIA
ncbi:MAG: hypothetical protein H0U76_10595, partial [Ktedonobacteraceae bacterium]|nr:hypothetical protein [Ktedonobacteraceae bacterium]